MTRRTRTHPRTARTELDKARPTHPAPAIRRGFLFPGGSPRPLAASCDLNGFFGPGLRNFPHRRSFRRKGADGLQGSGTGSPALSARCPRSTSKGHRNASETRSARNLGVRRIQVRRTAQARAERGAGSRAAKPESRASSESRSAAFAGSVPRLGWPCAAAGTAATPVTGRTGGRRFAKSEMNSL